MTIPEFVDLMIPENAEVKDARSCLICLLCLLRGRHHNRNPTNAELEASFDEWTAQHETPTPRTVKEWALKLPPITFTKREVVKYTKPE